MNSRPPPIAVPFRMLEETGYQGDTVLSPLEVDTSRYGKPQLLYHAARFARPKFSSRFSAGVIQLSAWWGRS
jgi:hypothetical protein